MEPTAGTCGWCGTPLDGRPDKQYCNASHRRMARRKRKEDRERSNSLSPSGQSYGSHASESNSRAADDRFKALMAADEASRAPQSRAREWAAYARRHGTIHPDEQAARLARGRQARAEDWQQGTSRFVREGSSIGDAGRRARAQHRPVIDTGEWDDLNDPELHEPPTMMDGGPFRVGYRHAGYSRQ